MCCILLVINTFSLLKKENHYATKINIKARSHSKNYYVEYVHFKRLMDATALLNGLEPEKL